MAKGKGKKNKSTVEDYVSDLDADGMTGTWEPAATWHRVHGDGKSTTGGKFHLEIMQANGETVKYQVRLMQHGEKVHLETYESEPSFTTIVSDLKRHCGA